MPSSHFVAVECGFQVRTLGGQKENSVEVGGGRLLCCVSQTCRNFVVGVPKTRKAWTEYSFSKGGAGNEAGVFKTKGMDAILKHVAPITYSL